MAAEFRFVGIEEELVGGLVVWGDAVAGDGFVRGEVDDEDEVGALGDEICRSTLRNFFYENT